MSVYDVGRPLIVRCAPGQPKETQALESDSAALVLPSGTVLAAPNSDPGSVRAVLYLLTTSANLLHERFPDTMHGYGLAWSSSDRKHQEALNHFLQEDGLTEEALLQTYHIAHRVGGPPHYLRCLCRAGSPRRCDKHSCGHCSVAVCRYPELNTPQ